MEVRTAVAQNRTPSHPQLAKLSAGATQAGPHQQTIHMFDVHGQNFRDGQIDDMHQETQPSFYRSSKPSN
jgi:hypothetical protein